jgi:trk system potassium uptake protein
MSLRIIIVGLGQVGTHLAKVLAYENHDVSVIESNGNLCKQVQENLDVQVLNGYGTDYRMLETAGIKNADMVVAFTGFDEQNILTCQMAAKYGVQQKIARIRNVNFFQNPNHFSMEDWGVDVAIQPELETAKEIVLLIKRSAATDVLEFAQGKLQLVGIRLGSDCPVLNKTMQDVSLEFNDYHFRAVAILRNNRTIIPTGQDVYLQRDQIFFVAISEEISNIVQLMGKSEEKLHQIMILGGGRIARETAQILENEKDLEIKLIESNPEKTLMLADKLRKTLIIEGDGRDFDLLATEGILETDALVSLTDDEETNILTSLLAKHLGVSKTIALVNRNEYIPIMAPIGVNAAVNTNIITSNAVLRLIRRGGVVSVASLPGIDAEILEYRVSSNAKITKKPLNKISFPKGAILGGITRNGSVFIPVGSSQIQSEDLVVVFALPEAIHQVEKYFL